MKYISALFAALLLPVAAVGQERPDTILVLDGSGSMWGQIEGVNKIVIAREVVSEILGDFPADQGLGLTIYGHRTEGDCSDIETLVAPATGTADEIVEAVNGINPRGKTPMTDAVIAAAEALGYRDGPATVVLVSDGIETCNPDPCAAARALEEAGADFTAHVVGFDVNDAEAIGQLQCLAEETGGQFLSASNASELSLALSTVAVAPPSEPEPVLTPVTFEAVIGENGPRIGDPVFWSIAPAPDNFEPGTKVNPLALDLAAGAYEVSATWSVAEQTVTANVSLLGADPRVVTMVFQKPKPSAAIVAPKTAVAGSTVEVAWEGPDFQNDFISVTAPNDRQNINYTYTREGTPANLMMPPEPGAYEIRYVTSQDRTVLASAPITVTPVQASIVAPATAPVGAELEVAWQGPDYRSDYIAISKPDDDGYEGYTYTREGSPLDVTLPTEPGDYEIRYVMAQDRTVIATAAITLEEVGARLEAAAEATAGSELEVAWEGPDYRNDFIAISKPDDSGYENYTYVREGSPLALTIPTEPGSYELRYYVGQDRTVLASVPIEVTEVGATIEAAERAPAGSELDVTWTGPDYKSDFIGVTRVGNDRWETYTYTREGSPLKVTMPTEPGSYELRYHIGQDASVLATRRIEVTAITAELSAPATAAVGEDIDVVWTGPDYKSDYVAVADPDDKRYVNYTYTREGSPLKLTMPPEAGTYELRYYVNQDSVVLATRAIEVTDLTVTLVAPDTAVAGGEIEVAHDGPEYRNDLVTITRAGADRYATYAYANRENPARLDVPDEPGEYVIRYVMNQGSRVLRETPLTVTSQ